MTDDHPNAEDWRNRCERAEQECAELREENDALVKLLRGAPWLPTTFDEYDRFANQFREWRAEVRAALAGEPAMTITDADREAAAECLPIVDEEWIEHERGLMRAGEMDGHPLVQAFARHRVDAINSIRGGDDGL